jgi:hypothetical protein
MVMLKVLKAFLGDPARGAATKKTAPGVISKSAPGGKDYRAVAIVPGTKCCAAAHEIMDKAYLVREAPRMPLASCTMPTNCSCKFKKASDRRDGDRRLLGETETGRWFAGTEKRIRAGRRSAKD